MRLLSPLWPGLFLVVCLQTIAARQLPPRDQTETPVGTASVSGRVVAGDTGSPQREVSVTLVSGELRLRKGVATDAEGRYAFTELPAGRYVLTVMPSRYRPAYLGTAMRLSGARGEIVELADGQQLKNHDLALARAGAISGRVVDEVGEPMAGIRVSAIAAGPGGTTRAFGFGLIMSDDRGHFRLFGLEPGDYYLKAEGAGPVAAVSGESPEEGYVPTYYPGTANPAEAPLLTLSRGQELDGLEIRLVRSRTFHISGLVLGSDGRPATSVRVSVSQTSESGGIRSFGARTKPDGTFEAANLAPGEYVVAALPMGGSGGATEAAVPVRVVIAGSDVENVTLVMTPGVTLRGHVVTDEGAVPPFAARGLRVTTVPERTSMASVLSRSGGEIQEDWTFEVGNVRAAVVLRTQGAIAPGYRLRAVLYRGIEITEAFTEFPEPTTTSELQLVISQRGGTLTGTVTDAGGRPAVQRPVVLFPAELERRTTSSLRFRTSRTDESGRYSVDGLPPGDYLVAAVDEAFGFGALGDSHAFDWLVPLARPVTLQGDEVKTLDLRLGKAR